MTDPTSTAPSFPSVEALRAIVANDAALGKLIGLGWSGDYDRRTLLALVGALREALRQRTELRHRRTEQMTQRFNLRTLTQEQYLMLTTTHNRDCDANDRRLDELLALCDAAGIEGGRRG